MRRITKENINTPEFFDNHFSGDLEYADIERLEKLAKHFSGGYYLEVGCFDSPLPIEIKKKFPGALVCALDFSPKVIEILRAKHKGIYYICGDITSVDLGSGLLDYVVAGEVIEHMEDPKGLIDKCMSGLRLGGWLAISTPLEESESNEVGGGQHLWSFTEQDFKDWGFETEIMDKTILAWKQK